MQDSPDARGTIEQRFAVVAFGLGLAWPSNAALTSRGGAISCDFSTVPSRAEACIWLSTTFDGDRNIIFCFAVQGALQIEPRFLELA